MFETKKFLLLLLAVVLMAASVDASVAYAGERQLSSKKASKKSAHKATPTPKGTSNGVPKVPVSKPSVSKPSTPIGGTMKPPVSKPTGGTMKPPVSKPSKPGPTVPVSVPKNTVLVPPPNAPGGAKPAPGGVKPPNAPGGVKPIAPPNMSPTTIMKGSKKGSKKGYGDHGKGKGSKKSSKKDSSSSSKSSKKDSNKKSSGSSADTPAKPISVPSAPSAKPPSKITAAPTSTDSFAVRPAPFALYYTFSRVTVNNPSIKDFNELAEVTREFLNTFFTEKYAQTSIIVLDDFLTFLTRSDASVRPTLGVFRSVARFNPRSIFYPPRSEIESEIKVAFTEPASQLKYLKMLTDKLPNNNPFKGVASITYGQPSTATTTTPTRVSSFATASIAAAAAGVVILLAGAALLGRKRHSDGDNENGESFSVKKSSAGSVDGETCAGTTWRSSASEIVNVEDLQDEPLDDDYRQQHGGVKLNQDY